MAISARHFYQKMYRRGLGATLVLGLSVLVITCLWTLNGAPFHERFSLYFDSNIHGLSVGSPVLLNGRIAGQVENIGLKVLPPLTPGQTTQYYADVTIQIDSKTLEKFDVIHKGESLESALPRLIAQGLRGHLRKPSLLANGLSLYLDFSPNQPAKTIGVPNAEYPEIPAYFKSTSESVDQANAFIESKNLFLALEKIQKVHTHLSALCLMMENIDYRALNEKALFLLQKASIAIDKPAISQELLDLNNALMCLISATSDHRKISPKEIELLRKRLRAIQKRLSNISKISQEINTAFSTSTSQQEKILHELKRQCEAFIKIENQSFF